MFIVFEGLDGSGSSTQSALLTQSLQKEGKQVLHTKEPTTRTIGKLVRDYLQHKYSTSDKALQLLFASDREDHLHSVIKPNLAEQKIVISDRYFFSSIAFGALEKVSFEWLDNLYQDFLMPDIVFLLKVPSTECIQRIEGRGNERELFEKKEVLEKVWQNYEKLAQNYDFIEVIDGTQNVEKIASQVLSIVNNLSEIH